MRDKANEYTVPRLTSHDGENGTDKFRLACLIEAKNSSRVDQIHRCGISLREGILSRCSRFLVNVVGIENCLKTWPWHSRHISTTVLLQQ